MYTQEQLDDAIERAAARGAALVASDFYEALNLDPKHPDYREHVARRREQSQWVERAHDGSQKTKTWLFRGVFTGVGTFIVTAIWKGWDSFAHYMSSSN